MSGDLLVNSVLPPVSMVIDRDLMESFSSEECVKPVFFTTKILDLVYTNKENLPGSSTESY